MLLLWSVTVCNCNCVCTRVLRSLFSVLQYLRVFGLTEPFSLVVGLCDRHLTCTFYIEKPWDVLRQEARGHILPVHVPCLCTLGKTWTDHPMYFWLVRRLACQLGVCLLLLSLLWFRPAPFPTLPCLGK